MKVLYESIVYICTCLLDMVDFKFLTHKKQVFVVVVMVIDLNFGLSFLTNKTLKLHLLCDLMRPKTCVLTNFPKKYQNRPYLILM